MRVSCHRAFETHQESAVYGAVPAAREMLTVVQAKGAGYSISREEELQTIKEVAMSTGEPSPLACFKGQKEPFPYMQGGWL